MLDFDFKLDFVRLWKVLVLSRYIELLNFTRNLLTKSFEVFPQQVLLLRGDTDSETVDLYIMPLLACFL